MNRRDFIKHSTAAVAGTSVLITACQNKGERLKMKGERTFDSDPAQMTYRINPNTGDKVSLLGFGMMRLPTTATGTARENGDAPTSGNGIRGAFVVAEGKMVTINK